MSLSSPVADWSALIALGAPRKAGQIPVRVGNRYLLVSRTIASALWHLHVSSRPLDPDQTTTRLSEVLPSAAAHQLNRRLWSLLAPSPKKAAAWRNKILRVSLDGRWPLFRAFLIGRALSPMAATIAVALAVLTLAWTISPPPTGISIAFGHWRPWEFVVAWALQLLVIAIHEAGHFVVAAHYNVAPSEAGFVLYGLNPVPYIDVTEAWLAPRRVRIAIASGGVLFQIVPTILFAILWLLNGSGLWLLLLLANLAFIFLNMLPMIRLDGYWMLANALDEPHLQRRCFNQLSHSIIGKPARPEWTGRRAWMAVGYAVLSLLLPAAVSLTGLFLLRPLLPHMSPPLFWTAGALVAAAGVARAVWSQYRAITPSTEKDGSGEPANAEGSSEQVPTWYVNPFRSRGLQENGLVLGALGSAPNPGTGNAPLSFLMRNTSVRDTELATMTPAGRDWLIQERFLLPSPPDTSGRWSRQTGFFSFWPDDPEIRQNALDRSRVCVLGLGTLGSQAAYLCAAAGVGSLTICDFDTVDVTNLNRQLLFREKDVGKPKSRIARSRLRELNSRVQIDAIHEKLLTEAQIERVVGESQIVVRAIDTPHRVGLLIDRVCRRKRIPHVGGGFLETFAIAGPFVSPEAPCFECLQGAVNVSPSFFRAASVIGPWSFWLSSYVAGDVIRFLTGTGTPTLWNRVAVADGRTGEVTFRSLGQARADCSVCGPRVPG